MQTASETLKVKYKKQIDEFEQKRDELEDKYEAFADIAEDKWNEAKQTFSMHVASLKEKLKKTFD